MCTNNENVNAQKKEKKGVKAYTYIIYDFFFFLSFFFK